MNQSIKSLIESFDDEAPNYDSETNTFHHQVSEYVILQNVLGLLNRNKKISILDSGGGTGKFALVLSKLGYNVELIDISPKSIQISQQKFDSNNLTINISAQNSEHTNYEDNTFDLVMLNGAVISYTQDPEQLLRETNRILKPNGTIVFDFFNTIGWSIEIKDPEIVKQIIISDIYSLQMPDWKYPARLMSIKYVEQILKNNGFNVVNKKGLINITHAFDFDYRYSKDYSMDVVKEYQKIELVLSNRQDCVGTAWSCIIVGKKSTNNCFNLTRLLSHFLLSRCARQKVRQ